VGARALVRTDVERALLEAAKGAGLGEGEIRRTIASGLKAGETRPRDLSGIGTQAAEMKTSTPGEKSLDSKLARRPRTELGNAERMVTRFGDVIRYCHPWSKWLVWDGQRWAIDNTAAANRLAKKTVRKILAEASTVEEEEARTLLTKWAITSESRAAISAMLALASSERGVPILHEEMDRDGWLFNCPNGTIDLRTGQLRGHRREDLITQLCPVDFDPMARCPLWDGTLDLFFKSDPELIGYWQRVFGYCLVGVIRDHVMPIAYGKGSNGKSTILGTMLEVLGRDYAMKCPPDMLMAKKTDSHPTDRADLFRKRLVVAIETESGRRLNETMVKELTGGDPIRARRMREDFWEFLPTHTLLMATNHKPLIRGSDNGVWRRLKLVPFPVSVEDKQADKAMPEKLQGEYPGILAWAVRGCLAWQRDGLEEPRGVQTATRQYRAEQDRIGSFLEEHAIEDPTAEVRASDLYARYCEWAKAGNEFVMSQTAFGTELQERGYTVRKSGCNWYQGIKLR
jgi:putative DNA primase/helicase